MGSPADVRMMDQQEGQGIGLFLLYDFHRAFLNPIHALLKDEFPCLITDKPQALIEYQPRVLIMSDRPPTGFRRALPHTLFVGTRHGFGSKNYARVHIPDFDFICLSSTWVRDECIARRCFPRLGFWVVGFVATDLLLRPAFPISQPPLPADFSRGGPTLLYAPTYNPFLRSIEMLGVDWIGRLRDTLPGVNVIIKPHPHTTAYPQAMAIVRELARRHERTLLADPHQDVYAFFSRADLLLTDVSSVMFFFLALDRPIVVVNNPQRFQDPHFFDPEGEEWVWRDMALQINRVEELPTAVRRCLEHPEEKAGLRAVYRERIYGDLMDGRATERLAGKVRTLLRPSPGERDWVEMAWNSLETINGLVAALEGRSALAKRLFIPLASFPALRAAVEQSPQFKAELINMVSMVLTGQLGQALPHEPGLPGAPTESRP